MTSNYSSNEPVTNLYSLAEVYGIEFGVRGIWTVTVRGNIAPPEKYSKAMLATNCSERGWGVQNRAQRVGNSLTFTPDVLTNPSLSITWCDDTESTIEHWLRDWWSSYRASKGTLNYPATYAAEVTTIHYNVHHKITAQRCYVVIPKDVISVDSGSTITATSIQTSFDVYSVRDLV